MNCLRERGGEGTARMGDEEVTPSLANHARDIPDVWSMYGDDSTFHPAFANNLLNPESAQPACSPKRIDPHGNTDSQSAAVQPYQTPDGHQHRRAAQARLGIAHPPHRRGGPRTSTPCAGSGRWSLSREPPGACSRTAAQPARRCGATSANGCPRRCSASPATPPRAGDEHRFDGSETGRGKTDCHRPRRLDAEDAPPHHTSSDFLS